MALFDADAILAKGIFGSSPRHKRSAGHTVANASENSQSNDDLEAIGAQFQGLIKSPSLERLSCIHNASNLTGSRTSAEALATLSSVYKPAITIPLHGSTPEAQTAEMPAARTSAATIKDVKDLLYHSPELQRYTTEAPESTIENLDLNHSAKPTYEIPHLKTDELDALSSHQKREYLTDIKTRAQLISQLGLPFMVFKDDRSVLVAGEQDSIEYIDDPEEWLESTLSESHLRLKTSSEVTSNKSHSASDHGNIFKDGWDNLKKTLTPDEVAELKNLKERAKFADMGIVTHQLTLGDRARLRDLEFAAVEDGVLEEPGPRSRMSGKAQRVLGVDNKSDAPTGHDADANSPAQNKDKKIKRKAALIGGRRRRLQKTSSDQMLDLANDMYKLAPHSSEESSVEMSGRSHSSNIGPEQTSSRQSRIRGARFLFHSRKHKSSENALKASDSDDVFGSSESSLRKLYIGMPILQTEPVSEPQENASSQSLESMSSSGYSGNGMSSSYALGLRTDEFSSSRKESPEARASKLGDDTCDSRPQSYSTIRTQPPPSRNLRRSPVSGIFTNIKLQNQDDDEQSDEASLYHLARQSQALSEHVAEALDTDSLTPTRTPTRRLTAIYNGSEALEETPVKKRTSTAGFLAKKVLDAAAKIFEFDKIVKTRLPVTGPTFAEIHSHSEPLQCHPISEQEGIFARALTQRNQLVEFKRELLSPTKRSPTRPVFCSLPGAAHESDEIVQERRPHTAPEMSIFQSIKDFSLFGQKHEHSKKH